MKTELSHTERLVRSFVRNAYLMYSASGIEEHRAKCIEAGDTLKARFMSEMIEECREANATSFCDLPAFSTNQ